MTTRRGFLIGSVAFAGAAAVPILPPEVFEHSGMSYITGWRLDVLSGDTLLGSCPMPSPVVKDGGMIFPSFEISASGLVTGARVRHNGRDVAGVTFVSPLSHADTCSVSVSLGALAD